LCCDWAIFELIATIVDIIVNETILTFVYISLFTNLDKQMPLERGSTLYRVKHISALHLVTDFYTRSINITQSLLIFYLHIFYASLGKDDHF